MTRVSRKGESTRRKILDAAELLFAEYGFHPVTVRDIAESAALELALVSYHFGTKENVLIEVIRRRSEEHYQDLESSLKRTLSQQHGNITHKELVLAYAQPMLEKMQRGESWRAYIKLIVGVQHLAKEDEVSVHTQAIYGPVIQQFLDAFEQLNPTLNRELVHMGLFALHGTLIHLISGSDISEKVLGSVTSVDESDRFAELLAEFLQFGFRGR